MDRIRDAIHHLLAEDNPMSVRQVFYQLVSRGVIAKTEGEYKQRVVRLQTAMRRSEEIAIRACLRVQLRTRKGCEAKPDRGLTAC